MLATLTLVFLYAALNAAWVSVGTQMAYFGWTLTSDTSEAEELARRSAAAEARLTPEHWRAAFQLGLLYGYLSNTQQQTDNLRVLRDTEGKRRELNTQSRLLGIGVVEPLPMSTEVALIKPLEEDRGGVAARVGRATSERLRHLFLLGAHVGDELSELELPDDFVRPPASWLIAEHGVLAGIPEPLWRPLARVRTLRDVMRSDKHAALAGYISAIDGLDRYLTSETLPHPDATLFGPTTIGELLDAGGKALTKDEVLITFRGATMTGKRSAGGEAMTELKDNGSLSGWATNSIGRRALIFGTWSADDSGKFCRDITIKFVASTHVKDCYWVYRLGDQIYVPTTTSSSDDRSTHVVKRTITH